MYASVCMCVCVYVYVCAFNIEYLKHNVCKGSYDFLYKEIILNTIMIQKRREIYFTIGLILEILFKCLLYCSSE